MQLRARVVRHDGASVLVASDDDVHQALLSRRVEPEPTVGDWVGVEVLDDGTAHVCDVEPRASLLRRRAAGRDAEHALAANVDVVFLVLGLDRPVRAGRIQRGATLAWDAGATPVVVLTKASRITDADVAETLADVHTTNPGVDVIVTSVREGIGVDALVDAARGRTVTLLGESGAGKSSIVNALLGAEVAPTGDVRAGDAKGRHTTTARQLHALPFGGALIDTPGIRAVGLWVGTDAVDGAFADVDDAPAAATSPTAATTASRGARWRRRSRPALSTAAGSTPGAGSAGRPSRPPGAPTRSSPAATRGGSAA